MSPAAQRTRRSTFRSGPACLLSALLFISCGKPAEPARQSTAPESQHDAAIATLPPPATGPGSDEKVCFQCDGAGTVPCRAPGCQAGQVDCPGPCLKLSRGIWIHMAVAGHDPSELWQKFPNSSGLGGYQAWNHHHVGEVIVYQNGVAVNTGRCKVCGGTTKVNCSVCKGLGKQTCEICAGKKVVPVAWTPTDNPWFNRQPDLIRLADGQLILGRVALSAGEDRMIVTRDKKILHVKASDILPQADTNSPPAQPATPK